MKLAINKIINSQTYVGEKTTLRIKQKYKHKKQQLII